MARGLCFGVSNKALFIWMISRWVNLWFTKKNLQAIISNRKFELADDFFLKSDSWVGCFRSEIVIVCDEHVAWQPLFTFHANAFWNCHWRNRSYVVSPALLVCRNVINCLANTWSPKRGPTNRPRSRQSGVESRKHVVNTYSMLCCFMRIIFY